MEYKHKLTTYQIDDDGDLKHKFLFCTDKIPQIGETIAYIVTDDEGKPILREYYDVKNILHPVTHIGEHVVSPCHEPVLHVMLTVSEHID